MQRQKGGPLHFFAEIIIFLSELLNMDQSELEQFWQQNRDAVSPSAGEWSARLRAIYAAGKGLHETVSFLHESKAGLEEFLNWMGRGARIPAVTEEDVLSAGDLSFFSEQGYIIVHQAITEQACKNARDAIAAHLAADMNDPGTWYQQSNRAQGLMVPLYQHPALEENRRSPLIRKVFEQLYNSPAIHAVIEKVSFNPPETKQYHFPGSPLHWDCSLAQPVPFKLQGLIYLSDCGEEAGAFHCVPGFHTKLRDWLAHLPAHTDPRAYAVKTLAPIPLAGKAGDLVIWHQALPHCATPNKSKLPRFVQYITYDPDDYAPQELWA